MSQKIEKPRNLLSLPPSNTMYIYAKGSVNALHIIMVSVEYPNLLGGYDLFKEIPKLAHPTLQRIERSEGMRTLNISNALLQDLL